MRTTAIALVLGACAMPPAIAQSTAETEQATPDVQTNPKVTLLDLITISATMGWQAVIDTLSATSIVDSDQMERTQASSVADLFRTVPGVSVQMSGDDPSVAVNIRGLEQYGRVAVTLDGARQDYWRVGHGSGSFFLEPELLKQVTVIRGPASNAYGTGGIGGVVAFETKSAGDFLNPGETWALSQKARFETNGDGWLSSTTGAYSFSDNADFIGNIVARGSDQYKDGNGDIVRWTGEDVVSGYGKATFRPAEGHEIKLGAIIQDYSDVITGSSGSATASRFDASTRIENYTGSYTYNPLDNDIWDLSFNAYHSKTRSDQDQFYPTSGTTRYYDVATTGFNLRNATRFDAGGMQHTLTYGGDYAHLTGESDADHFGGGTQDAYGGFLQWEGQYSTWLDLTAAIRYDGYELEGMYKPTPADPLQPGSLSGNRWSPRFTIGVTPVEGFQIYGTYAEGYRTPHLQDIFRQSGSHSSNYEPNLFLRPEVARSWEAGVNLRYDDVMFAGDMFRAKINLFHSEVEDYINTVKVGPTTTSQNVGTARLRGIELEGIYDYGWGFVNAAASFTDAVMKDGIYAGETITNTPLDNAAITLGFRAFEDRLTYGLQYQSIGAVTRVLSSSTKHYPRVDLVNLFANWDINDNLKLDFAVDNLFDKAYTDPQSGWATSSNIEQAKGRTFKVALTGRIGG